MSSVRSQAFPLLKYAVGANGVLSLGIGFMALADPLVFLKAFDLEVKTPEARKVAKDLLIVFAARDIALGFGITSAAYYGHRKIMGWSMVGVSAIALLDGLVSRGNVKGGERKHWFFIVTSLGLAAASFGYV